MSKLANFNDAKIATTEQDNVQGAFFGLGLLGYRRRSYGYSYGGNSCGTSCNTSYNSCGTSYNSCNTSYNSCGSNHGSFGFGGFGFW